ncbi:TAXI family TRAP transporter solute-binding subunit [Streptomyces sp. URMC 123]|uniref:TAXI family TRAP transporter solute-binding subunit n=1 Tax=Streptomyces sp. URMC 123 TaxID=3423403 RepID=UPI003F1DB38F
MSRRRVAQAAAAVLTVCGLLLWYVAPWNEERAPRGRVLFSTGSPEGVYSHYGELLKRDFARDLPGLDVRLAPSKGSIENLQRLVSGRADLAVVAADSAGVYRDEGRAGAERLSACARLYDDYIQLVVDRNSPVRTARDLRNKRVGVGEDTSGVQLVARRLLTAAGLDMDKDVRAHRVGIGEMASLLRAGRIDAFFWSGGLPTMAVQKLARHHPIRLVELGDLASALQRDEEENGGHRYYRSADIPADAYPELRMGRTVPTLAVANLLVATDRMDPVLVEGITRRVIKSRDRIGRVVHAAQRVDLGTAIFTDPLPLHEGARRYYQSVKP